MTTSAAVRQRRLTGTTPLWIAARTLLLERGDNFFALLERAGEKPNTEVIHDLRVASRRLREALTLFAPCYPEAALAPLRRKFRGVTRALGELRNVDEAYLFLRRLARQLEGAGREFVLPPLVRCRQCRQKERERLRPALERWRDGALARRFHRVTAYPRLFAGPDHPAFLPVAEFARAALDPQISEIPQLLPVALREEEIAAQHRLRIAVKHFRYRAEILAPLLGSGFRDAHATLKAYQEELGKMHDLDIFAALLAAEAESGAGREAALATITAERHEHFQKFAALHEKAPLPEVAEGLQELV